MARMMYAGVLALAAGHAAMAQTYSYSGPVNGGWHNASHWSPSGIPGINPPGVDAVVGMNTIVQLLAGDAPNLNSLMSQSPVRVWTGLILANDSTITDLDLIGTGTGGFSVGGLLTLAGDNSIWRSGRITGNVKNTGILTIGGSNGTSGWPHFDGQFRNDSFVNHLATAATVFGTVIENHQTWTLQGSLFEAGPSEAGGEFKNFGTLRRLGAGEGLCKVSLLNQGTIYVSTGMLRIETPKTEQYGTVTLENGGILRFIGTPLKARHSGSVNGVGDYVFYISDHRIENALAANLSIQSADGLLVDCGSGSLEIAAPLVNSGRASFRSGRIYGGTPFTNAESAAFFWYGGTLEGGLVNSGTIWLETHAGPFLNAGTLFNSPQGQIVLSKGQINMIGGGTGMLVNQGLLHKAASSSATSVLGVPVQLNSGSQVEVNGQNLLFNRDVTMSGTTTITVSQGNSAKVTLGAGLHTVTGGVHTIAGGGTFDVSTAAELTVSGGRIENTMTGSPGFLLRGSLVTQPVDGFLNNGSMTLSGGQVISSPGGFENNALLTVTGGRFVGPVDNNGFLSIQSSAVLHLGQTSGAYGGIHNRELGIIEMVGGTSIQTANPDSFLSNEGLVRKIGPGAASVSGQGTFSNDGLVEVTGGSLHCAAKVAQLEPSPFGFELAGGAWKASLGSTLTFGQSPIVGIGPGASVIGHTLSMPWLADIGFNSGIIKFSEDSILNGPLKTKGGSKTSIGDGVDLTIPNSVENGSPESVLDEIDEVFVPADTPEPRLITPQLINHARLIPGGHDVPGPFNLTGNLVMHPTGRIVVELGGLQPLLEHDRVAITGSASLDGTLQLDLIDSFVPQPGQQFTVLTATGGISGTFDAILPPLSAPANISFEPIYTAASVIIQVGAAACYANCDGSTVPPVLNVSDFGCFLQKFAAQDPYANCDGSSVPPTLNVSDFGCFLQKFALGCN